MAKAKDTFIPQEEMDFHCPKCKKLITGKFERSIADSGRAISEDSTFEYICEKCGRSYCFSGHDIIPEHREDGNEEQENDPEEVKEYAINKHFRIGETISHPDESDPGKVVGVVTGKQKSIIVKFGKSKIKRFIEDIS